MEEKGKLSCNSRKYRIRSAETTKKRKAIEAERGMHYKFPFRLCTPFDAERLILCGLFFVKLQNAAL